MKVLNRLTFDNFIMSGEVNEGLPLYNKDIENFYKLSGSSESYYPDILISDKIYLPDNDTSLIKTISYIDNSSNGNMIFPSNKNAFIEIDKSLALDNKFEFEIKIKVKDFSNPIYKIFSIRNKNNHFNEIEFELYLDSPSRRLLLFYPNQDLVQNKVLRTLPDLNNNTYYMSGAGDINNDIWYTIKLIKYENIISLYINNRLCRTIYNKKLLNPTNVFIGAFPDSFVGTFKPGEKKVLNKDNVTKSITGEVEYVSFKKYKDNNLISTYIDFPNGSSISHKMKFNSIIVKDLILIDNVKLRLNNNDAIIEKDGILIDKFLLEEDNEYFLSYIFNKTEKNLNIYVFNYTRNRELLNININVSKISNLKVLDIDNLHDLTIYKKPLSLDEIKRNMHMSIMINKSNELYNDISEEFQPFKLNAGPNGSQYFLPLSNNFNSLDNSINNNIEGQFLNAGCRSGQYKAHKITNLLRYEQVSDINNIAWDNNLHKDGKHLSTWGTGCNEGVVSPNIGYHAKFVMEGSNNNACIKMINCNAQFGLPSRWLGISRSVTEFCSNLKVGDKIKIVFRAKADMFCRIQIGIYRKSLSSNQFNFGNNLTDMFIKDSNWNSYTYEATIDANWNLSEASSIYFYQSWTEHATLWIDDIYAIVNGNDVDISLLENNIDAKIKIPFSNQIALDYNQDFSLIYQKKIISLEQDKSIDSLGKENGLFWGIKNNKLTLWNNTIYNELDINVNEFIGKWLTIAVIKNQNSISLHVLGKGINKSIEISTNNFDASLMYNSTFNYDLMLGGQNDVNYGCNLYKNLTILKNHALSSNKLLDYYQTKISLKKNKLLTNVEIIESVN